jgi:hypothetical protein
VSTPVGYTSYHDEPTDDNKPTAPQEAQGQQHQSQYGGLAETSCEFKMFMIVNFSLMFVFFLIFFFYKKITICLMLMF